MAWPGFDHVPLWLIVAVAIWLALAHFVPEPHLTEKLMLLANGTLKRPIDIVDLLYHLAPIVVLVLKLVRMWQLKG